MADATPSEPILAKQELCIQLLIVVPCVLGFIWSFLKYRKVAAVKVDGNVGDGNAQPLQANSEKAAEMSKIAKTISDGAISFLFAEYTYMAVYVVVFGIFLYCLTGIECVVSFVIGSVTSILAGWIGMKIAVFTNVRTAHECWRSLGAGFAVAIDGGCVMGLSLVSIGVLMLFILIEGLEMTTKKDKLEMYEAIAGYGLGGSSIALFGRVGGGIYTKAADVGADLSGKNDYGLEEDDYRNPACIADNVGDNVGDIAGMGADLFGSFAEATCAALVIVASTDDLNQYKCSMMYPILISSVGIVVGILTLMLCAVCYPIKDMPDVEKALKGVLIVSTAIMCPVVTGLSYACLPSSFVMGGLNVQWYWCAISINLGLWSGLLIGVVTEYYTSHSYQPVREIAETQKQSAATGIIYGLALGYLSCIIPVLCLGITILISHMYCGMFGVALGALGMLGTMTVGLTIDAYGPISDNAGGIAEMAHLPDTVRGLTDCLDAAGNTTAAIGKGFAIGSAALVSLALFGAYTTRAWPNASTPPNVNILDPWVFTGLLFGAMMPYAFAAWTMKSVGKAANDMVIECNRQFPEIFKGKAPDYERCITISTQASLREMLAPGALVILSPMVAGIGFGKNACAGLLTGALCSSVQLAISMSNTGGAWDNSKKYISAGGLGKDFVKGSEAHKNSVTGDTVGDPLKDTSGPALNIVMKLTAIISLVLGAVIEKCSDPADGSPAPWNNDCSISPIVHIFHK